MWWVQVKTQAYKSLTLSRFVNIFKLHATESIDSLHIPSKVGECRHAVRSDVEVIVFTSEVNLVLLLLTCSRRSSRSTEFNANCYQVVLCCRPLSKLVLKAYICSVEARIISPCVSWKHSKASSITRLDEYLPPSSLRSFTYLMYLLGWWDPQGMAYLYLIDSSVCS